MRKNGFKDKKHLKYQTIQWFTEAFVVATIAFFILLVPVLIYSRDTFRDLQLEKYAQKVNSGIITMQESVDRLLNASQALSSSSVFRPLKYKELDYDSISYEEKIFMRKYLSDLVSTEELFAHVALLLEPDLVILKDQIFWKGRNDYYPDFFHVNDSNYEEWVETLKNNKNSFLPVSHVTSYKDEYEAIIYSIEWGKFGYLYACLDVEDIKDLFFIDDERENCFIEITRNSDKVVLYSNVPEQHSNYQILSGHTSFGNINVKVFIGNEVFSQSMRPLYLLMTGYAIIAIILVVVISLGSAYFSVYPLFGLLDILDKYKINNEKKVRKDHFEYISNRILAVEENLKNYQEMNEIQQKNLCARYMEKALNGNLVGQEDVMQFRTCFPEFPEDGYYLFRIRLWTDEESEERLYKNPLLLLSLFLEKYLACFYIQERLSDTELLLIAKQSDFEEFREKINFVVDNVNHEEEHYHIQCFVSKPYRHLENLSVAYTQACYMESFKFANAKNQVCMLEEGYETMEIQPFISKFMSFYTAVSCGNEEMALEWLHIYSEELKVSSNTPKNKCMFKMICAILNCIKIEQMTLLAEEAIPSDYLYKKLESGESLESLLSETISNFCDKMNNDKQPELEGFTKKLVAYVDEHFTDSDICITFLADYFERSPSNIRKIFKEATNTTIAAYIEQKRMYLANEILAQKKKTIIEVARECGYINPNSFYKAYRRFYGFAPSMHTSSQKTDEE